MRRLLPKTIVKLAGSTRGATAIEYGLIAALVTIACIGAMKNLAGGSGSLWSRLEANVVDAM